MNAILLLVNLLAAGFILLRAIDALNHMGPRTAHTVRVAYYLTALGAFAVVAGPIYGYVRPQWSEVLLNSGFAGYLMFCRRYCERITGGA
jgi:hypothetical protein